MDSPRKQTSKNTASRRSPGGQEEALARGPVSKQRENPRTRMRPDQSPRSRRGNLATRGAAGFRWRGEKTALSSQFSALRKPLPRQPGRELRAETGSSARL